MTPPKPQSSFSSPEALHNFSGLSGEALPTMYDLPSELPGEPGLPDEFHRLQADLLSQTCQPPGQPLDRVFTASDLNLYYDLRHPLWYKRPDWFLTLGLPRANQQDSLRWSYVIWQEKLSPSLMVELLSPGTEAEDMGQIQRVPGAPPPKWVVYEQVLRIPYYVLYDRYDNHLRIFRLEENRYQPITLTEPRYWVESLSLGLGVWQGIFCGAEGRWLRWYDINGHWLPTDAERAERAEQRAQRLAEHLQSLGIDPDTL